MLELAEIFCQAGAAWLEALPSDQRRVVRDLLRCRTAALGGHRFRCDRCGGERYSYHSCRNRHCPKCHGEQTRRWLEGQRQRLLQCPYFLVTFTLPAELRPLARRHPKQIYDALFSAAAGTLQRFAADPGQLGARLGLLAVLHTWTRTMTFHPHVHILVTAGGWGDHRWIPPRHRGFLFSGRALSIVFRAQFQHALARAQLTAQAPTRVWRKPWVVHAQHAGTGTQALEYLARYVFRIAIANSRIERIDHDHVTFRYRDNRSQQLQRCRLTRREFLRRFLLHLLPARFTKVRSYGLFSTRDRSAREQARTALATAASHHPTSTPADFDSGDVDQRDSLPSTTATETRCPFCEHGVLRLVEIIPRWRGPPAPVRLVARLG